MTVRDELGVSDEDYEWLLEATDHECWICGEQESVERRRLAVDHDHRTGAVRGLLCTRCNRRLGGTVDPEWLRRAAEYLEVAARAFGDMCDDCWRAAPSRRLRSENGRTVFLHECCGTRWTVAYHTHGIPFAWTMGGANPFPRRRPPLRDPEEIGHPGAMTVDDDNHIWEGKDGD